MIWFIAFVFCLITLWLLVPLFKRIFPSRAPKHATTRRLNRRAKENHVVVDGSNVMYWDGETPNFQSVRYVIDILKDEGFVPLVWFDANVGYLIGDQFMGNRVLAGRLNLPEGQVFVAPKGTPADPLLLNVAQTSKLRVVTNDRYRDWEEQYPWLLEPGVLIRGYINADSIGLELNDEAEAG